MLKKHSQFFEGILFITDLALIAASWIFAYYLRFYGGIVPPDKGIPDLGIYLALLVPIVIIWAFAFKGFGLYRPRRLGSHLSEIFDITKASVLSVLILIAVTFYFRQYEFSRLIFLFFTIINIVVLSLERMVFREVLRVLRRHGYNLRYALVVGTGESAEELIRKIDKHNEIGIKVLGVLGTSEAQVGGKCGGAKIIATYGDIRKIIINNKIDHVFIALPWQNHSLVLDVLKNIGDEAVNIRVVPDVYEFMTLRGGVEELDGMPLVNLQDTPLFGWNIVIKRTLDVVLSIFAIILTAPVLIAIALLIKIFSPGPVFFRQTRMGIGGETFDMLKFRSMKVNAEKDTGAVWTIENDPRRTRLGTFLRKTSLDELPQFFNVLKGDMSIVGPRPERPVFIEEFRKSIPGYMLRHKMKAGITGWAQVNGWRGNTDLKKRIEHDLYYIENWSLGLDIRIMWLTVWKGLVNRNAY